MSNLKNRSRTTADKENDEVEELLRAAEEDVFLKLSLNSHTLHGSSSQTIHPDLDRRFHALKSNHKSQPHPPPKTQKTQQTNTNNDDADLLGRFEALKKTLPSYQNHENSLHDGDDDEEEDEVEKVIRWAKDAARLDPSPVSDTDEDQEKEEEEEEEESDDDYDSEEDDVKKLQKGSKSKSNRK